jgi:hypothetical protein
MFFAYAIPWVYALARRREQAVWGSKSILLELLLELTSNQKLYHRLQS